MKKMAFALLIAMIILGSGFLATVSENVSAAGVADSPWPMFRGNVEHTGLSQHDTSNNLGELLWRYRTNYRVYSSPAIGTDGTIYVGSEDYFLYAVNSEGKLKWRFRAGDMIDSSPAIGTDGTIYVGSDDHYLYALNPDGTRRWRFTTFGVIRSSPAIGTDGTIYVGSNDGSLYAINPDGTQKWEYDTGNSVQGSPAIGSDGTIYICSYYSLYAINPDGTQKWEYDTGNSVQGSPAIGSDGTIYVGSFDTLFAVNPDGSFKWEYRLSFDILASSPAIGSDGTIYFGSSDGVMYAINPDGTLKWSYDTGSSIYSSPAIGADGTIYFGSNDGRLYALNPDGTLRWRYSTGNDIRSSPAIGADGTIYVGSYDYYLYAIGNERPPSPPRNLRVVSYGSNYINITWDVPADNGGTTITSYKIYRGDASGEESYYTYVKASKLYFNDTAPLVGAINYYYVTAINSGGESDPSNEVYAAPPTSTRPSPPINLTAEAGDAYVDLSWEVPLDDGGSQITEYRVYRGTSVGDEALLKIVSGSLTSYRDTTVDNGYTYYYYVTAVNNIGESDPSNEATATPKSAEIAAGSSDSGTLMFLGLLVLVALGIVILLLMKKKRPEQPQGNAGYPQPENIQYRQDSIPQPETQENPGNPPEN